MSGEAWPRAELGKVARLRVLAAGLPGAVLEERIIDAPFDRVWPWVADLERSVPIFDRLVASVRVTEREGGRPVRIRARGPGPGRFLSVTFDVDLDDGWCWMVSRPHLYLVGMAAEAQGSRTRWAHLEGFAMAAPRFLRPVLAATRWRHRRHVAHDIDGITRAVSQ